MKRKYKYVVDEEKALRYKVLFKMFCANCTTTIDKLKDKYEDIPKIIKSDKEEILNINNYVFVVKCNETDIKINRDYIYKRQKGHWIPTYEIKAFHQFQDKLGKYEFIIRFYHRELLDIICKNKLYNRYVLYLKSNEQVYIYDNDTNKLTYTKDIKDYKKFLGADNGTNKEKGK